MTGWDRLIHARLVAVVTLDSADDAIPLGRALRRGGIGALELALRTPAALEGLRRMRADAPELLIGAGTVLRPEQADAAKAAGADFALAPGLDEATIRHCSEIALPFIPGVATASEIQKALALGCRLLKWFPAEPLGGVRSLRTLAAPFLHLGARFLPLGGIDATLLAAWLAEPSVAAVGGSWIATTETIRARDWARIERQAAAAIACTEADRRPSA